MVVADRPILMKAHQLIHAIGPDLQKEIISYLQTEQRAAYRAVLDNLAVQRKLRPVFLQKKTKDQQAAWLLDQLGFKSSEAVAEQILQIWLLKGRPQMLVEFLDAIGVEHNGSGEVEQLPDAIDAAKARSGIECLLKKFPPRHVAVYLHLFQMQKEGGWPGLAEAMSGVDAIRLQEPVAA